MKIKRALKFLFHGLWGRVRKSIRIQLMITFAICLLASLFSFGISDYFFSMVNNNSAVDYYHSMRKIDNEARQMADMLTNGQTGIEDKKRIQDTINFIADELKVFVLDLDGHVLFKSENAAGTKIDLHSVIRNIMEERTNAKDQNGRKEFFSFYPIDLRDEKAYVVVSGIPNGEIYFQEGESALISFFIALFVFIILFLFFTRKKMHNIEELAFGLLEMSKGNLDFRVNEKSPDELGSLAHNINYMAEELQNMIARERAAEKTKNELITNVSHDLRTPLTSIMGYLRLLKDKKYENTEQFESYLDIAYVKSEKLKSLIEDLFEYAKLHNEGVELHREKVDLDALLNQLSDELVPICAENNVVFAKEMPSEKIIVDVDPEKIVRVFENLFVNAIKYSKPGEIRISLYKEENEVTAVIANKGEHISEEDLPHLFERFYRIEKSRSSDKGGSGLGLAIAKNIVEMHGGKIWAESDEGEVRFLVKLSSIENTKA